MKLKLLTLIAAFFALSFFFGHISDPDDTTVLACCTGILGTLYCLYLVFQKNIKQLIDYIKS